MAYTEKEQLYASRYTKEQLQSFATAVNKEAIGTQAYIFFNNDINTSAVYNAKELQEIVHR